MSDCALTVCRGCCCGHDDPVEAQERLDHLRQTLPQTSIRTSDCLGPCERKEVIVVSPSSTQRRRGIRPIWLGWMSSAPSFDELTNWIRDGGPGASKLPEGLGIHVFAAGGVKLRP
jgi:hypothetical protein